MRAERDAGWLALPGAIFLAACSSSPTEGPSGKETLAAEAVVPPSAHCHVTDGKITTCPDGLIEWSDVAFVSFPERQSFVHSAQADLDPTRSSPGSPVDTLVLLYDLCDRTTPLGLNEFFQVSFTSVAADEGGEWIDHYRVNVFPDGTIRFIENGIPHTDGRAKIVEEQRGAVGFGPTPTCPFDHVVVEYQVALDAAGGNGFSTAPSLWTVGFGGFGAGAGGGGGPPPPPPEVCGDDIDNDGDGEVDETCPPGPRIKELAVVQPVPGPIEMSDRYRVKTTIVENNQTINPIFAFVNVAETVGQPTAELGDCAQGPSCPIPAGGLLFPSSNASADLTPLVPQTFLHPSLIGTTFDYQHTWRWMGHLDEGCTKLLTGLVNPIRPILHGPFRNAAQQWITGAKVLSAAALSLTRAYVAQGLLVREGTYEYAARAEDQHGTNTAVLGGVAVRVPQYKEDALTGYWASVFTSTVYTGFSTQFPALALAEPLGLAVACSLYDTAVDPNPDYQVIATEVAIDLPELEALPPGPDRTFAELWLGAVVRSRALATTLGRYEGAKAASDEAWVFAQLAAAETFQARLAQDFSALDVATEALIADLEGRGIDDSPEALEQLRAQILDSGLPELEQSALRRLGFSDAAISDAAVASAGLLEFVPSLEWRSLMRSGIDSVREASGRIARFISGRSRVLGAVHASPLRFDFESQNISLDQEGSSDPIPLGFSVNFFGHEHSTTYINSNGSVSFGAALGPFVPLELSELGAPVIAPFHGHVLASFYGPTFLVNYGTGEVDGHRAFQATWPGAPPFATCNSPPPPPQSDAESGANQPLQSFDGGEGGPSNTFQVVLVDRSDVSPGDFDIEFNFESIEWDISDDCVTQEVSRVGYSDGTGPDGVSFELEGSGVRGGLVDQNDLTGLANNARDASRLGRFAFEVRGGIAQAAKPDSDRDGVIDEIDNCFSVPNVDQRDSNLNRLGDACETPDSVHGASFFVRAQTDGNTFVERAATRVGDEPSLLERLVRIVRSHLDTGLATSAVDLTAALVHGLVTTGVLPPGESEALINAVLDALDGGGDTNEPPVAACRDVTIDAGSSCSAFASVDGGSTDPDGDSLTCGQSPAGPFGLGPTNVTLTCTDPQGASASCSSIVTVIDDTAPTLVCPEDEVTECVNGHATTFQEAPSSTDNCSQSVVSCEPPPGSSFALGSTPVTCTSTDEAGNAASCGFIVDVRDTLPPLVTVGQPRELWPPNHKYVTVTLAECGVTIVDQCFGPMTPQATNGAITCVTSDEPDLSNGAPFGSDAIIVSPTEVRLRSERMGQGDGRVYTIHFNVEDAAGNAQEAVCRVTVPHDQSGQVAVDSGAVHEVGDCD